MIKTISTPKLRGKNSKNNLKTSISFVIKQFINDATITFSYIGKK